MIERFSEQASHAIWLARKTAYDMGSEYCRTEHLLHSLCRIPNPYIDSIWKQFGIDPEALADEIKAQVIPQAQTLGSEEEVSFTPRAKKAMELAVEHATARGNHTSDLRHLLWGILAEGEGIGVKVLQDLGFSVSDLLVSLDSVEDTLNAEYFGFLLDPGDATSRDLAELFGEMSKLYQMVGGRGLRFKVEDCRLPHAVEV